MKAAVYPPGTKGSFEKLIDDLGAFGVGKADQDAVHELRRNYNAAKHDPAFAPPASVVERVIGTACAG